MKESQVNTGGTKILGLFGIRWVTTLSLGQGWNFQMWPVESVWVGKHEMYIILCVSEKGKINIYSVVPSW